LQARSKANAVSLMERTLGGLTDFHSERDEVGTHCDRFGGGEPAEALSFSSFFLEPRVHTRPLSFHG